MSVISSIDLVITTCSCVSAISSSGLIYYGCVITFLSSDLFISGFVPPLKSSVVICILIFYVIVVIVVLLFPVVFLIFTLV